MVLMVTDLPAPIVSRQRGDLSGLYGQVDIGQCPHRSENFAHPAQFEERRIMSAPPGWT